LNFLNRGRTGAAEQPALDQPSEPAPAPRRRPARKAAAAPEAEAPAAPARRRRGQADDPAAETPARRRRAPAAAKEAAPAEVEAPPAPQAAAEPAPRRSRAPRQTAGSARGAAPRTGEPLAPGVTIADEATEAAIAAALAQKTMEGRSRGSAPAPEAQSVAEAAAAQPAETASRRSREARGRGRGRGRREGQMGAQEPQALASPPPRQALPPPAPGRNRGRREAAAPVRVEQTTRGGTVESLIARQNVLFEQFADQQQQALREVQRAITNLGRGGGSGQAVAPIVLPKVGVFLDVPNVVYAAEDMGVRVDFGKLLDYLTRDRQLVRATAYAPITDDPNTRFENQRFVQPVLGHGYKVVTKPWKRFADGGMKANFDIELAVDILTMSDRLDIVVLLSGDSDFKRVLELVESKGVRVEVCAFGASTASELRAVADEYIDLASILNIVGA